MIRVLVADDHTLVRAGMVRILTESGLCEVVAEASDGREAVDRAIETRPHVVVLDITMPRLNGIELTKRIRQELPHTSVILISSYTEDAYRLMASDSGADAFVSKRVIHEALLPALRDLIRRISGGSGPLPPSAGTSPASAASK